MSYFDRLVNVRTKTFYDFHERIGKPITMEEASKKAHEDVVRMHKLAAKEKNETVIDVTTGKTYKRSELM